MKLQPQVSKKNSTNPDTSIHKSLHKRPLNTQSVKNSLAPLTQQERENQQYQQDSFEAAKLQIQAKYGNITAEGQEQLAFLQAKKAAFWQQHLRNTRFYNQDSSQVPVHGTEVSSQAIQTKLTIGAPGDKYEQEADRVAASVVKQINAPVSGQPNQNIQREGMPLEDELMMAPHISNIQREAMPEEEELQTKPQLQLQAGDSSTIATAELGSSIQQARGGGQPLADNIRKPMEQAFGADFSGVKVHTDSQADQLNQSIQAKAFTTGQDVFFRQGEYNPGSRGGQELIAHELTHVVQQSGRELVKNYHTTGVVQRLKIKVQETNNTIKSVSYPDKSRPGGNIRSHQGDHTTAFASFLRMVRNQIMGKNINEVPTILEELLENLSGLPGMQIQSADYLHQYIPTLQNNIQNIKNKNDIENILEDIVSFRNKIPLSAYKNSTSTGGHGEGANIAALQECEDRYRNGNPPPRYNPADITRWMWEIFDYNPSSGEKTDIVINILCQHIYSMHLTFPNIFKEIKGYDCMFNYLEKNAQLMLHNLDPNSCKNVLAGVKSAVDFGPSALPKIGASKFYNV